MWHSAQSQAAIYLNLTIYIPLKSTNLLKHHIIHYNVQISQHILQKGKKSTKTIKRHSAPAEKNRACLPSLVPKKYRIADIK